MRRRRAAKRVLINRDCSAIAGCRNTCARSEQSVLSLSSNRFLIGELHLGKLSETIVVHGNAPHNHPRSLVSHLIGNRARASSARKRQCSGSQANLLTISLPRHLSPGRSLVVFGEAVISADRARRFDTLRGAPARRLRQSIPLQYLIIEHHQHFELCERCLPKVRAVAAKSWSTALVQNRKLRMVNR